MPGSFPFPPIRFVLALLAMLMLCLAMVTATHACPPTLGVSSCQVQQFVQPQAYVQPQAFYAAPIVQQQLVQQVVHPQRIVVQQVRQHHAQAIVQQVQVQKVVQSRVQVQRSRTVIRNR